VFRSDTCIRSILSKPLETFTAVTLDHLYSVYKHYTKIKSSISRILWRGLKGS
jgi:hypothetical protein